jgi:3-oxoacyl-[acyl-carrier protein] reductase
MMEIYALNKMPQLAVVTGSSSGIGLAITSLLLDQGWNILGVDRSLPSVDHANYEHLILDLLNDDLIHESMKNIKADAFVHAAGFLKVANIGELDLNVGTEMWHLHTHASAAITNQLINHMKSQSQGRIVYIGSRVSSGFPGRSQYAATKAALVAMAKSWAAEVASSGITVNVVSPAATQTAMTNDPLRFSSQPKLPPIGRFIKPEEIAHLVAFLLSSSAAAITGQEINICGGSSLNH